jgi:tetracenomycin A2 monooxygenase-dioxygenase
VSFNTELFAFEQHDHGIVARIRDRVTSHVEEVSASYLIGADGSHSQIRDMLNIGSHGPGVLQRWMNVIFETDLEPTLHGRPVRAVFVTDINGTLVPRGDGRWLMAVQYWPEAGQKPEDFTKDYCRDLIRHGVGRTDLRIDLVDVRPWDAAAAVADRYVHGRVFLVGDSAHVMPPTGGFGGNTGIHDAYNLAWKVDSVLRGTAGTRLLDTYDQERRFVADRTVAQALARLRAWFPDPANKLPPAEDIVADEAVIFGYRYRSGAFIPEGADGAEDAFEDPRAPTGRPGSRAPHLLVESEGQRESTVDLFSGDWVLFAGPEGAAWPDAAARMKAARHIDLRCETIGDDEDDLRDIEHRWTTAYHTDADGAVLIRPDGFIAWRGRDSRPGTQSSLEDALERLAFREP